MARSPRSRPLTLAQRALVEDNKAQKMARRTVGIFAQTHPHIEVAELHALAQEALVLAAPLFDPARGVTFASFASRRVHGHLMRAIYKEWLQQSASGKALLQAEPVSVPDEEGSEAAPEQNLAAMKRWLMARGLADVLITLRNRAMGTPEEEASRKELLQAVEAGLKALPLDHARVLTLHYLEGVPLKHVAKDFSMSATALGRLHRDALVRLRHELAQRGYGILDT